MRTSITALLAAAALIISSASPAASQIYECTTTTITTTVYSHDVFGNYYETTVTRSSKVCIRLT
jgi:hypothetical protein